MKGNFGGRRGIWLKNTILFPFLLVFLLDLDEGISFLSLKHGGFRKRKLRC